jgi:hypothetical protein
MIFLKTLIPALKYRAMIVSPPTGYLCKNRIVNKTAGQFGEPSLPFFENEYENEYEYEKEIPNVFPIFFTTFDQTLPFNRKE